MLNLDTLRDPAVIIPITTTILGFGMARGLDWLKARKHRRTLVASLRLEAAKRTPDLNDDLDAEIEALDAKDDEARFDQIAAATKDPTALAGLLVRLLVRPAK